MTDKTGLPVAKIAWITLLLLLGIDALHTLPKPISFLRAAAALCFVGTSLYVKAPAKASTLNGVYQASRSGEWRMSTSGKLMTVAGTALLLYSLHRQYAG